ncbi:LysR family transcriptional regulator [Methylovirgula sp. 4M-Z18]|nr:LysR family transcriptional regulator [Methylovirgula sp. 4M-Z18]
MVVETGSFTAAATELHLSQSAVSRQIQQLEYYFGCRLFERHTRKVVLTEQGAAMIPIIDGLLISLRNSFEATRMGGRSITVRMPPTFARRWLLPRLPDLHHRHENLNITIDTAWFARPTFTVGDIDLLITYGNGHWPGMDVFLLLAEKLTPMCSPDLADTLGHPAEIEKLRSCVFLHSNPRQSDWALWLQAEGAYDLCPARNQIFDTQDFAMTAAATGYGITMGDLYLAEPELKTGELVRPFPRVVESRYGYYAVYPSRSDSRQRVADLIAWLMDVRQPSGNVVKPGDAAVSGHAET